MPARRNRPALTLPAETCGVQEQPVGYTCNLAKGHRGNHKCKDATGKIIVSWNEKEEWHGPVLHAADGPKATRTLCGERAGTPAHPITYSPRLVRCKACLAALHPTPAVIPVKKARGR